MLFRRFENLASVLILDDLVSFRKLFKQVTGILSHKLGTYRD